MDPLTMAMVGGSLLQGIMGFGAERAQAKAAKKRQQYMNKMTALSNAMSQDAITMNDIFARDASSQEGVNIQQRSIVAQAAAEAQAAASGTAGRSVNQTLFDLQRSADVAENNRAQALINHTLTVETQRRQSSMQAAMQMDHSFIPKPSLLGALVSTGMSMGNTYQNFSK